jgi:hypothetical protein
LTKDWIVFAIGEGWLGAPFTPGVGGKNLGMTVVLIKVATWNAEKVQ